MSYAPPVYRPNHTFPSTFSFPCLPHLHGSTVSRVRAGLELTLYHPFIKIVLTRLPPADQFPSPLSSIIPSFPRGNFCRSSFDRLAFRLWLDDTGKDSYSRWVCHATSPPTDSDSVSRCRLRTDSLVCRLSDLRGEAASPGHQHFQRSHHGQQWQ